MIEDETESLQRDIKQLKTKLGKEKNDCYTLVTCNEYFKYL